MHRARKIATAAGGLFAAAAVAAPAANAATYEVNSLSDANTQNGDCEPVGTNDGCMLREAIFQANNHTNDPAGTADVITFAPSLAGTIQLQSDSGGSIEITVDSLDIVGPGADKLTVAGAPNDRIFKIFGFDTADEKVNMSGLTLTGGTPDSDEDICGFYDSGGGGAIWSLNTTYFCHSDGTNAAALSLSKMAITGNEAEGPGGGVLVETRDFRSAKAATATGPASLTINQSTINDNNAGWDGGGVAMYPYAGSLAVNNSTIVDNNASGGDGGGIFVLSEYDIASKIGLDRTLEVDNSTVTGNDASNAGGGIATDGAMTVSSSIVAENTVTPPQVTKAPSPSDLFTDGTSITLGHSLVGTLSGASVTQSPAGSNLVGVAADLGTLQNNGGPTQTRLPANSSPAIDAGTANGLTVDQRDLPRTVDRPPANAADGTDIGAVEIPADPPVEVPEDPVIPAPATELCFNQRVILTKGDEQATILTGTGTDDGILGAGGTDTIDGLSGDDCLYGQVGNDLVIGGPGVDNANGDRDDDTVNGDAGNDSVRGQNGDDKVSGGEGDDSKVTGGAGDDKVSGGPGDDLLKGDGGNDKLNLGTGEDFVHSGGGADVIDAADGDKDRVICGTGKDVARVDPQDKVDEDCNTVDVVK